MISSANDDPDVFNELRLRERYARFIKVVKRGRTCVLCNTKRPKGERMLVVSRKSCCFSCLKKIISMNEP